MSARFSMIEFSDVVVAKRPGSRVVCIGGDVHSKTALLDQLAKKLEFPYFGHNWDSLLDLLSDFSWLKCTNVTIQNDELKGLAVEDFMNYVLVLQAALVRLERFSDFKLHVIFPSSAKVRVTRVLNREP